MKTTIIALAGAGLLTAACTGDPYTDQRMAGRAAAGAAIGGVAGAVLGNNMGSGNAATGAAIGAAVGAGVGAATTQRAPGATRQWDSRCGRYYYRTSGGGTVWEDGRPRTPGYC